MVPVGGPESSFFEFSPRDDFTQLAVSVSWNPFLGFERREEQARARAEKRRARARRRARKLELERRVRSGVDEIRRRFEQLEALRENRAAARERLELARMRYEADRMEFDRYQTFIDEATRAERAFVEERTAYLTAWAELEEVVGEVHFPSAR